MRTPTAEQQDRIDRISLRHHGESIQIADGFYGNDIRVTRQNGSEKLINAAGTITAVTRNFSIDWNAR